MGEAFQAEEAASAKALGWDAPKYVWNSKEARMAGAESARGRWEETRSERRQRGLYYSRPRGPVLDFDFYP